MDKIDLAVVVAAFTISALVVSAAILIHPFAGFLCAAVFIAPALLGDRHG